MGLTLRGRDPLTAAASKIEGFDQDLKATVIVTVRRKLPGFEGYSYRDGTAEIEIWSLVRSSLQRPSHLTQLQLKKITRNRVLPRFEGYSYREGTAEIEILS